jgi:hypothetical protein
MPHFYKYIYFALFTIIVSGCNKAKMNKENEIQHNGSTVADVNKTTIKSDYEIQQHDSIVTVLNKITNKISTVLMNEHETEEESAQPEDSTDSASSEEYHPVFYFNSENQIKLLIGPYLSYKYSYDGSGGVHPINGSYHRTINVETKKEVPLDSLFDSIVIFDALLKDSIITNSLTNKNPKDLTELVSSLDGGCEISFHDFLKSYEIISANLNSVAIEFGLTHGCEAARGNFTTIEVVLPISSKLKKYIVE